MGLHGYIREGITTAIIMGAGDMIAQFGIEKRTLSEWDKGRTARFSAIGLVVIGPTLRKWYGTLDGLVGKEQPALRRGLKKMAIDQVCFAPVFTLILSFAVPFINGEEPKKVVERIKSSYFTIMSRNYMLWPAAQTINFTFVPRQYQVIYCQLIAVMWNSYLSVVLNK